MSEAPHTVTQTAELIVAPQVRTFAERRYLGALFVIPLLVAIAYFAVRRLSSLEEMLAREGTHATRLVVYELPVGSDLHAPIEPGTDVMRFVVHAYRRGEVLPLSPRDAKLAVNARGDHGSLSDSLDLDAPGARTRVTADEEGLDLGDPVAFDIDVHEVGVGELVLKLDAVDGADGLLVRVYRREQLSSAEAALRGAALDRTRKDQLARWTWETGWDDLTTAEQRAIIATRWHRLGALRGTGRDLRSIAVVQSPRTSEQRSPHDDALLGRVALRGDERIALMLREGTTISAQSDSEATLRALVRNERGESRVVQGAGAIELTGTAGEVDSVELSSDRDALVDVRARDPDRVDWMGYAHAWKATAAIPVVVESPDADRVLRITLRRPMDRRDPASATVAAKVEVTAPGALPTLRVLRAERRRSHYDRYEALDPMDAPSERAIFYAVVPRGAVARIAPAEDASIEVSLSELDMRVAAEPLIVRVRDAPPPTMKLEGEGAWTGFVARRPSNASAFEPDRHLVIRVARRWVPFNASTVVPALAHVRHNGVGRGERDGRAVEAIAQTFEVTVGDERPAFIPMAIFAGVDAHLRLSLDAPLRPGAFERVTLPRMLDVRAGEWRATYVIGDDVPPGKIRLHIESATPGVEGVLVHVPWAITRSHTPVGPRWIAGQFEE